jgi:hypothetical protein
MKNRTTTPYNNYIKVIFCVGILLLLAFKGQAQGKIKNLNGSPLLTYQNGFGLRLGNHAGLTYKHFMRDANALDFSLATHYDKKGIVGTVMFEWHRNAFEANNLLWFYGLGGHVGTYKYQDYYAPDNSRYYKSGYFPEVGADAIIGIEYKFPNLPWALSVDVKPYVNFVGGHAGGIDGALSVRYTF